MSVEISTPGKKLSELRVIDLKQELDKRGLEKTGVKASLLDRLKKALENEGEDPEQYVFDLCGGKKSKSDDSLLEESEEQAEDKKADDVLTEIDLDGVDCEIADDAIDLGDFVETDVEIAKHDQEKELNEKSETAPEEQKPELGTVMETGEEKPEIKPEAPEIKVDEVNSPQSSAAENSKEDTGISKQEANKENLLCSYDLAPPTPTSVPVVAPFTSDDTIKMDTSSERKEDDISLIVHVDESQNEFDMPETPSRSVASEAGSIPSTSCEEVDKKIEEKAAADAEKAFMEKTGGEESVSDGVTPTVDTATTTAQGDLKEKEEKMDTETTAQDKQDTEAVTTANSDASSNKETSAAAGDAKSTTKKPDAKSKSSVNSRNLWISGLSTSTRATDLKALFSKYGKVAGAKVVTNARSPGSRCYGFVSMNTAEEASKCIQYLHRTELHGRMISVERAKTDPSQAKAIAAPKKVTKPSESKEEEQKKEAEKKDEKEGEKKEGEKDKKETEKKDGDKKDEKKTPDSRRHSSGDRRHSHGSSRQHRRRSRSPVRSRGHSRHHGSKDRTTKEKDGKKEEAKKDESHEKGKEHAAEKKDSEGKSDEKKTGEEKITDSKKSEEKKDEKKKSKEKEMLSLEKIKEERERERLRQRERRLREEERRRRELADRERVRQREIMARQREEAVRLQRERERLKLERERLEREKLEAEREKLRLERERRERERQELAEQRRLEALRYEERQRAMKRPYENRGNDDYWGEPKRATYEQRDRYSDYDGRPQSGYNDQRDRGYQQDRQVDRYDRNAGRAVERDQRGYDRRDEPRGSQARGGAADRRDAIRRDQPQSRDRDDRNRPDDRYNKYESERDNRRDVNVRDHDRREQRRPSPHRPAPRDSPTRRNDPSSSGYRGAPPSERQSRDRAHENRTATDRTYSGHGPNQRGGDQNTWQSNNTAGPREAKDTRSYPRSGGAHSASNGPGTTNILGTSAGTGTWAAPDRRPAGHMVVQQTADPRGWQAVTSVAPRTVVNTPILQPAPTTNAFLASAANIMMGVGLARGGDARYDAYKTIPANLRRY